MTKHVINSDKVVLEGDAVQVARGICHQVVGPVAEVFAKHGGASGVVELYAGLITFLALDVTTNLDEVTARQILSCAGDRVTDLVAIQARRAAH